MKQNGIVRGVKRFKVCSLSIIHYLISVLVMGGGGSSVREQCVHDYLSVFNQQTDLYFHLYNLN